VNTPLHVKCAKCEKGAVVRVTYARLNLCSEHYIEYFEKRVLKTIEKYGLFKNTKRVLVAVSGGKDSLTVLRVLSKYRDVLGVTLAGVHLDLGVGVYSERSREAALSTCSDHGVECRAVSLSDLLGYTLPELVRKTRRPPCSLCGLIKRYVFNVAALEWGFDVVVTGHHMDDILVFRVKEMLMGQRESEVAKLLPFTPGVTGFYAARARPLYEVYEWEIELYSKLTGLKYVEAQCPFKYRDIISSSVAEMLGKIDSEIPGFKITLARRLAKRTRWDVNAEKITPCQYCGMPSSSGVCALCKFTLKTHGKPMGLVVREKLKSTKPI